MQAEASAFVRKLRQEARNAGRSLALPESTDPRVLDAAYHLLSFGSARYIQLFGEPDHIFAIAKQHGIALSEYHQALHWARPSDQELRKKTAEHFAGRARARGKTLTTEELDHIARSPLDQAAYLLSEGNVDAVVAGCVTTTAEVIRSALRGVGLSPGVQTLSGSFAMVREPSEGPKLHYMFADCGVVVDPTAEQLVDIAKGTVETFQALFPSDEPVLAFLSFSTKGSATHPHAQKMADAAAIFKAKFPAIISDGELQFDAALIAEVGHRKAKGSLVPGRTNCFVFPDLNAGNIAYKIAQRLAGFDAYGPILQGTTKPFNDLSRGAVAADIEVSGLIAMLRSKY
jgi:phosphate acetyltransferase